MVYMIMEKANSNKAIGEYEDVGGELLVCSTARRIVYMMFGSPSIYL